LTMPSGSAKVLGTVRRETIKDPDFYGQFFTLVQGYVGQEKLTQASLPATNRPAPLRNELPDSAAAAPQNVSAAAAQRVPAAQPSGPNP